VVVAALAALPAAAADGGSITSSTIGGAGLGETTAAYTRALGRPFVTRLGNGTSRLSFKDGTILVYLGSTSRRGIAIVTADAGYRTAKGIQPCSTVGALTRAYGGKLKPQRLPGQTRVTAYRLGQLLFTVTSIGKIGAIALMPADVPISWVRNGNQCGESGEGD
jgi:hypothetical protein